jgi:hypothetical protein
MSSIRLYVLALSIAPVVALAATQYECPAPAPAETVAKSDFRVINPKINAWARGTVFKVGDGELSIQGANMPFATTRAEMHQEMHARLAGVEDPGRRLLVFKQVKDAWGPKLDAALKEKTPEAVTLTFKGPTDIQTLVILDAKSIRDLPFFQKMKNIKERREKMGLSERDFTDLYDAHEQRVAARAERRSERPVDVRFTRGQKEAAAAKIAEEARERAEAARAKLAGERLAVNDLKAGDEVFVGYNTGDNTAYTIVRNDKQPND